MTKLNVPDMSCGHCAGVITKPLKALDQDATVSFDMGAHTIEVSSDEPLDTIVAALAEAGYPATVQA